MRRLLPIFLVLASALLLGAAFPPVSARPLAWVALAPLFVALRQAPRGSALLLALLWSVFFPYTIGDWMPRAIEVYYLQTRLFGWLFYLAVVTGMLAPYVLLFTVVYRALARRHGPLALPLLAGAAWAGCELLRARLFTGSAFFSGNPWGIVGYSQVGAGVVVQAASWAGVYGIGFAIAAANAGLAELALTRSRRTLAAALPGVLLLVVGAAELRGAPPSAADAAAVPEAVPVAVVQGNLDTGARWRAELYGSNLETYLRLTLRAARDHAPRVVFWPEAAMTFFLEAEPAYRRSLASVLGPADLELVAGGVAREGGPENRRYRNAIFALTPEAEVRARYDKQVLLPFGEYFPLRSVEFLRRRFERVRTFEPGPGPVLLPSRAGALGVATCNEAMLPEVVAARVAAGAEVLVNPSNDTWIPEARFAELQLDIVRLRAVEQRRWLVRASTSGPSAIVDPWGRVLVRSGLDERTVIAGAVVPRSEPSVYGRVGDLCGVLCLAAAALGLLRRRASPELSIDPE